LSTCCTRFKIPVIQVLILKFSKFNLKQDFFLSQCLFVFFVFLARTWTTFRDYEYINSTSFDISTNELTLLPGYKYRITLRLCAKETCFKSVSTDGIMIISSPLKTGSLTLEHQDGSPEKVCICIPIYIDWCLFKTKTNHMLNNIDTIFQFFTVLTCCFHKTGHCDRMIVGFTTTCAISAYH